MLWRRDFAEAVKRKESICINRRGRFLLSRHLQPPPGKNHGDPGFITGGDGVGIPFEALGQVIVFQDRFAAFIVGSAIPMLLDYGDHLHHRQTA